MKKMILFCLFFACVGCTLTVTHTITGTIEELSVDTITIRTGEEKYSFTTTNVKEESIQGFLIGEEVEITYHGHYETGVQASKIKELKKTVATQDSSIPSHWQDEGVFRIFYQQAYQKLTTLTLEEKIGQIILARTPEKNAIEAVWNYHLGGFVLFGRDFQNKTKEEVLSNISSYQKNSTIPLIMATDEEGGSVNRVSRNPLLAANPFPSPQEVYQTGGMSAMIQDTKDKVTLLRSLGINLNLAPVADVSTNPHDFIYQRSFGKSGKETAEYVKIVATTYHEKQFGFTLKHFPGYGNNKDTHTGIALDKRPLSQFETEDFLPFEAGIESGAPSILVSHNIVTSMDPNVPASLSPAVHELLRKQLHFTGVIMTDDLAMGAIAEYTNGKNPALNAFLAGNDLLLTTDYEGTYQTLKEGIENGTISMDQLDHSVFRILAWKYQLGLFN